jgi:hypothetical protein
MANVEAEGRTSRWQPEDDTPENGVDPGSPISAARPAFPLLRCSCAIASRRLAWPPRIACDLLTAAIAVVELDIELGPKPGSIETPQAPGMTIPANNTVVGMSARPVVAVAFADTKSGPAARVVIAKMSRRVSMGLIFGEFIQGGVHENG